MKQKIVRAIAVILLVLVGMFYFLFIENEESSRYEVTLSKCVDGDTAWFQKDEEVFKTRFLAINAPELNEEQNQPEAYALEAKEYACTLLKQAKKIELEADPNADFVDSYDRRLVWIWVDDRLLQELLVKEGYAKVAYLYDEYQYVDVLLEQQKQAQFDQKRIWKGIDR
ncbi:MAG: thermonuclease family protein [Erysipelotrichaceae bacterium]|nr:thermonuclease family protein [Erysipelotrichaceae bacterium]